MMTENKIIEIINGTIAEKCQNLDKNKMQDAVCFQVDNPRLLFTIDDFSAEDQFRNNNAYSLGWNMVIGGVSDILASGGVPKFYGHSLMVDRKWSEGFIRKLSEGIADAINITKMTFIGGDLGVSEDWKYTASVIGEAPEQPVNRIGAKPGDVVYLSGKVGAGNFEAALNIYQEKLKVSRLLNAIKTKFVHRFEHSQLMKIYASCAIDTSDGVFNALNTISELNTVGYYIENLVYISKASVLAKVLSLPKELLFLGECGEYELLFCVNSSRVEKFEREARLRNLEFFTIGKITEKGRILDSDKKQIDLSSITHHARDFKNIRQYLANLIQILKD